MGPFRDVNAGFPLGLDWPDRGRESTGLSWDPGIKTKESLGPASAGQGQRTNRLLFLGPRSEESGNSSGLD